MLKIPWTEQVSNEDVYNKIKERRWIWTTRGRFRQSYMKQIMLDLGIRSYKELKEVAMDREE